MDTVKGILIILVLALAGISFVLFTQQAMYKSQLNNALIANDAANQLLKAQGVSCNAQAQDFVKTADCITPLLQQKDFKEDGFSQPDDKKDATGYIIIKNVNRRAYDSQNFTFLINRDLQQHGCKDLTGLVDYNTDCRFDILSFCEKGTVLEVTYTRGNTTTKIFTKNC
jgi:hypothetical protein